MNISIINMVDCIITDEVKKQFDDIIVKELLDPNSTVGKYPRISTHQFGYIVFIDPELDSPFDVEEANYVYEAAKKDDCFLINFDVG